jgi:hypothetical protein
MIRSGHRAADPRWWAQTVLGPICWVQTILGANGQAGPTQAPDDRLAAPALAGKTALRRGSASEVDHEALTLLAQGR